MVGWGLCNNLCNIIALEFKNTNSIRLHPLGVAVVITVSSKILICHHDTFVFLKLDIGMCTTMEDNHLVWHIDKILKSSHKLNHK